jgi:hypothetical protein
LKEGGTPQGLKNWQRRNQDNPVITINQSKGCFLKGKKNE